jgi:Flp pilus assembly protein TadD
MSRALEWFETRPLDEDRFARAQAFYFAGRHADAALLAAALAEGDSENPDYLGVQGASLAALGRSAEALEISARLAALEQPGLRGRHIGWRAAIASLLDDSDRAVRLLGEAFDRGYAMNVEIHRDPSWDPVRAYPPFRALIRPR